MTRRKRKRKSKGKRGDKGRGREGEEEPGRKCKIVKWEKKRKGKRKWKKVE